MERDLRARLAGIEDERKQILESAQDEMQARLEALEEEITSLRNKLRQVGAQELAEIEARRRALEKKAQAVVPLPAIEQPPKHPIHVGDVVWVERLKSEGKVMEIDGDEAQVQSGRLRLRLSLDELEWRSTPQPDRLPRVEGVVGARCFAGHGVGPARRASRRRAHPARPAPRRGVLWPGCRGCASSTGTARARSKKPCGGVARTSARGRFRGGARRRRRRWRDGGQAGASES